MIETKLLLIRLELRLKRPIRMTLLLSVPWMTGPLSTIRHLMAINWLRILELSSKESQRFSDLDTTRWANAGTSPFNKLDKENPLPFPAQENWPREVKSTSTPRMPRAVTGLQPMLISDMSSTLSSAESTHHLSNQPCTEKNYSQASASISFLAAHLESAQSLHSRLLQETSTIQNIMDFITLVSLNMEVERPIKRPNNGCMMVRSMLWNLFFIQRLSFSKVSTLTWLSTRTLRCPTKDSPTTM